METLDEQDVVVGPKPKTPEEMNQDPKEILNPKVVGEMGADEEITKANDQEKKKVVPKEDGEQS